MNKRDCLNRLLNNLTQEDIENLCRFLMEACDVLMTYDQAAEFTGKSKSALTAKISRSVVKPVPRQKMIRYSDVVKIKNKTV